MSRSSRTVQFRAAPSPDGLTLEGYAAVFGDPVEIDDWEGRYVEQIERGAFAKTLRERTPILQFDHGSHPLLGSIPLGSISRISEDDHGLHVEARLSDNWLVEPVRDAIRDGGITGMSFQFEAVKQRWDNSGDMPARTLQEVRLFELGPVVWPAYESTDVAVRMRERASQFLGTPTPEVGAACADEPVRPLAANPRARIRRAQQSLRGAT